jgi:signal transduction histidine kinase
VANDSQLPAALAEYLAGEREEFFDDLADGLHAMAQPLTILRSSIAMLVLASESVKPQHRCLEISSRQIDRVCGMFESLQNLIASQLEPANLAPTDLKSLLTRVAEDQTAAFRQRGVQIVVIHPDSLPQVLADASRTEQTLSTSLETALSISTEGDKVEVVLSQADEYIATVVTVERGRKLNSSELLNLSVVKANMLSQRGRYQLAEEPFRVTVALPLCKHEEALFTASAYSSSAQGSF